MGLIIAAMITLVVASSKDNSRFSTHSRCKECRNLRKETNCIHGVATINVLKASGIPVHKKAKYFVRAFGSLHEEHFAAYGTTIPSKNTPDNTDVIWNDRIGPIPIHFSEGIEYPPTLGLVIYRKSSRFKTTEESNVAVELIQINPSEPLAPRISDNPVLYLDMNQPLRDAPLEIQLKNDVKLNIMVNFQPQKHHNH